MILSKRVALGGVQLDEIDPSIVIRSVDPGATKESVQTAAMMGGSGQQITSRHFDTLDVAVSFAIDLPKKQLAERRTVFDQVMAWAAAGGWLTVNFMTGKRVYIDSVTLPSSADLWNWTEEFQIVFRANAVPFWQDATATSISITSGGTGTIAVPGIAETVCSIDVKNTSGSTIDTLTVEAGDSSMSFTDLGLLNNEVLSIGHKKDGTLFIRIYTGSTYRSALGKRTGGSADDLYVKPGNRTITVSNTSTETTASVYGRYL